MTEEHSDSEMVPFFDVKNGRIISIPRSELASGAIQVDIEGVEGLTWVLAGDLRQSELVHPPLVGDRRRNVEQIHEAFSEHRDLSFDDWEDGFRRDANPDSEIAIWLHAAGVYCEFAENEPVATRRQEIHKTLIACLTTQRENIWDILTVAKLTEIEAQAIIDRYHENVV